MTFKRTFALWFAVGVVVINLGGGIFAYLTDEPMHGFVHGALALGFGLWANHLRQTPAQRPRSVETPDKVELLQADLSELERELRETQQRLDFADQLLRNKPPST